MNSVKWGWCQIYLNVYIKLMRYSYFLFVVGELQCLGEEGMSYSLQNHCLQERETCLRSFKWQKKRGVVEKEQCCKVMQSTDAFVKS